MKLIGKIIILRLVEENDAHFILQLRNKAELKKYISDTNISLEEQKEWIKNYKIRERQGKEFYFVVINKKTRGLCGTVRIYNVNKITKTATWGSFILDFNRPDHSYKEVIDISLEFALKKLNLNLIELDVRKENKKAIYIYEKEGFILKNEDKSNYYYYKNIY